MPAAWRSAHRAKRSDGGKRLVPNLAPRAGRTARGGLNDDMATRNLTVASGLPAERGGGSEVLSYDRNVTSDGKDLLWRADWLGLTCALSSADSR